MTDNIVDARDTFIGKSLIDHLEKLINYDPKYHVYCLLLEENNQHFIELRMKEVNTDVHTVIDKAPTIVYQERKKNGQPLFKIHS